jgi:hypothetical protein
VKIVNLLINEDLLNAEAALGQANSDELLEACNRYLKLLNEYRDQLHSLGGMPEMNISEQSRLGRELVEQSRKAVRAAAEAAISERNKVEGLIDSFTLINAWDAAETFNRLKHKGSDKWEMTGSRVGITGNGESMGVQEAVETARMLRREVYAADKITFARK